MSRHRMLFFAALSMASYACSAAAVSLGFAFAALTTALFEHVAERFNWRFRIPAIADVLTLPRRAYVGPPVGLRYEAGRPSLAAARGI